MTRYMYLVIFYIATYMSGFAQNPNFFLTQKTVSNQEVVFQVRVDSFVQIASFQYTIIWDPQVLNFQRIDNIQIADLKEDSFGKDVLDLGGITVVWLSTRSNGLTLADTSLVFELVFDYACNVEDMESAIGFSDIPTDIAVLQYSDDAIPVFVEGTFTDVIFSIAPDIQPSISIVAKDNSCVDSQDAFIELIVEGNTAPYEFLWNNGESTSTITDLQNGNYSCIITDKNGCTYTTDTIEIQTIPALSANTNITEEVCYEEGGSIDLTVSGGTQPYAFLWSNGAVSEDLNNLLSGIYDCTITDANQCAFIVSQEINTPSSMELLNVEIIEISSDQNDGSIDIVVEGGILPYTYEWSNGESTNKLQDLGAGEYACTVTDNNGCQIIIGPFFLNNTTSTHEFPFNKTVSLSPNPAIDKVAIKLNKSWSKEFEISLVDIHGRVFNVVKIVSDRNWIHLDVSFLPKGIYFTILKNDVGIFAKEKLLIL